MNNKIHWEQCRNLKASIKYCSKEDTRKINGQHWSYGIEDRELWYKQKPLMEHKELLANMRDQMIEDIPEMILDGDWTEWEK